MFNQSTAGETNRVDSFESTARIDNIFNPPQSPDQLYFRAVSGKSTSGMSNRQKGNDSCRFDGTGSTNRFPVSRIANTKDESTLVGCLGQHEVH